LVWVWIISPKNPKFFNFLPFGSKKSHRVVSKSTWVKGQVGLLFTAGQKYAQVGSGQGPLLSKNVLIRGTLAVIDRKIKKNSKICPCSL